MFLTEQYWDLGQLIGTKISFIIGDELNLEPQLQEVGVLGQGETTHAAKTNSIKNRQFLSYL